MIIIMIIGTKPGEPATGSSCDVDYPNKQFAGRKAGRQAGRQAATRLQPGYRQAGRQADSQAGRQPGSQAARLQAARQAARRAARRAARQAAWTERGLCSPSPPLSRAQLAGEGTRPLVIDYGRFSRFQIAKSQIEGRNPRVTAYFHFKQQVMITSALRRRAERDFRKPLRRTSCRRTWDGQIIGEIRILYVYIYIYIYMYVCMYVCMYICIY